MQCLRGEAYAFLVNKWDIDLGYAFHLKGSRWDFKVPGGHQAMDVERQNSLAKRFQLWEEGALGSSPRMATT